MKEEKISELHIFYIVLLFCLMFLIESIALYCAEKYTTDKSTKLIIFAVILYGMIPLTIIPILCMGVGVGKTNIIWNVASNIYGLLIGLFIFKEVIHGTQWLGIILAFTAMFLIMYSGEEEKSH
jgi:drug/metabolite transporter (DMT)-like permease